jgi:methyl-accepting chemotaxis protein
VQSALACSESTIAVDLVSSAIRAVAVGANEQIGGIGAAKNAVLELSQTATQIAQGAGRQATAVSAVGVGVAEVDRQISALATLGETLAIKARDASTETQACAKAVADTAVAMVRLRDESSAAEVAIQSLEQRSSAVGTIVQTIEDIAEQTNLLALNAAIESARAGEHGRGFAVVAEEVRKLAERSAAATREIGAILAQIARETMRAAEAMRSSSAGVAAGIALSDAAKTSLDQVDGAVAQTRHLADDLASRAKTMHDASANVAEHMRGVTAIVETNTLLADQMERSTNAITQAITPVASAADEQAAAAQSVLAAVEQLGAQVREISETSRRVREQAQGMAHSSASFRTGAAGATTPANGGPNAPLARTTR